MQDCRTGQDGYIKRHHFLLCCCQLTNADGLQHSLQVSNVIHQASHKCCELPALTQQLLCCLNMLFLQGCQVNEECCILTGCFVKHVQYEVSDLDWRLLAAAH